MGPEARVGLGKVTSSGPARPEGACSGKLTCTGTATVRLEAQLVVRLRSDPPGSCHDIKVAKMPYRQR